MNMQPGIKTEVKTYIRGFKQTVQTLQIYVQIPSALSHKNIQYMNKPFQWAPWDGDSFNVTMMCLICGWPADVWAVWTLSAWQGICRINTLGWCFKQCKGKVWVYIFKLLLLWRKQLTFLVCHTCKDISLSIHLACFGFRLFCCEVGYTVGYMLWDMWGNIRRVWGDDSVVLLCIPEVNSFPIMHTSCWPSPVSCTNTFLHWEKHIWKVAGAKSHDCRGQILIIIQTSYICGFESAG